MYVLDTWRNPYEEGWSVCRRKQIEIQEGLTVLVGCNGFGKSTTLLNLRESLRNNKIPCFYHDNQLDGENAFHQAFSQGQLSFISSFWTASEGERIYMNVNQIAAQLKEFVQTGETAKSKKDKRWHQIFGEKDEEIVSDERFLLLDAIDSGFSIDNVVELKDVLHLVIDDAQKNGIALYIIVSANEYELAAGEQCLDVSSGKYISFKDYNDYRQFILNSRKKKEKRYKK